MAPISFLFDNIDVYCIHMSMLIIHSFILIRYYCIPQSSPANASSNDEPVYCVGTDILCMDQREIKWQRGVITVNL